MEVPFNMKQQQQKTPMVFKQQQIVWFLYTSSLYESVAPLVARRPLMSQMMRILDLFFSSYFFVCYFFFPHLFKRVYNNI